MKKRSLLKRIAAMAMSAALLIGMTGTVNAATIDTTQQGTLQIRKLQTGTTTVGIEGVEFSYYKVGDFVLTGQNNVNGFTLDDPLKSILVDEGNLQPVAGETDVYDGKAIQDALKLVANQDAVKALATDSFQATDENGETDIVNVELGIYLVVEKKAPEFVTKMADPFILSVPTIVPGTGADEGTESWEYNVVAQPKNDFINTVPTVTKTVNGLEATNASIEDTLKFESSATIPVMAGTLEKYVFTDTASEGITISLSSVKVWAVLNDDSKVEVTNDNTLFDTPTLADNVLQINFKANEVQNRAAATYATPYKGIMVSYDGALNNQATVAVDGGNNLNTFKLSYTNNPALDLTDTASVSTYGFTLLKNNENNTALEGATFKLYDAATAGKEVSFYTAVDGNNKFSDDNPVDGITSVNEITTGPNGQASFYGLKAGKYYLEETKAPKGYNLLKNRVEIEVTDDMTSNEIDITIVNTKGFELPATGGMGTILFTVGGIVIMLGAAIMLIRSNKRGRA